jgi:hypothetical protein
MADVKLSYTVSDATGCWAAGWGDASNLRDCPCQKSGRGRGRPVFWILDFGNPRNQQQNSGALSSHTVVPAVLLVRLVGSRLAFAGSVVGLSLLFRCPSLAHGRPSRPPCPPQGQSTGFCWVRGLLSVGLLGSRVAGVGVNFLKSRQRGPIFTEPSKVFGSPGPCQPKPTDSEVEPKLVPTRPSTRVSRRVLASLSCRPDAEAPGLGLTERAFTRPVSPCAPPRARPSQPTTLSGSPSRGCCVRRRSLRAACWGERVASGRVKFFQSRSEPVRRPDCRRL